MEERGGNILYMLQHVHPHHLQCRDHYITSIVILFELPPHPYHHQPNRFQYCPKHSVRYIIRRRALNIAHAHYTYTNKMLTLNNQTLLVELVFTAHWWKCVFHIFTQYNGLTRAHSTVRHVLLLLSLF